MKEVFIIKKGLDVWPENFFFTSHESAINYIRTRVPDSHRLAVHETKLNTFFSRQYGTNYSVIKLNNFSLEQQRIANEYKRI